MALSHGELSLDLTDEGRLAWQATGLLGSNHGHASYDAVELAPGAWFVDLDLDNHPHESLTVAFSLTAGWAAAVVQDRDPARATAHREPAVRHTFCCGTTADRPDAIAPTSSTDLVGRWHRYRYSPANSYEHVYISADRLVSHNLETQYTPDRADCHPAHHVRLDAQLYLVGWCELDSQMAAVVVEDLASRRLTGKIWHPLDATRSVNVPVGGHIRPATIDFPIDETEGDTP